MRLSSPWSFCDPAHQYHPRGQGQRLFPILLRMMPLVENTKSWAWERKRKGGKRRAGPGAAAAAAATATAGSPSMTNEPCGLPSRKSSSFSTEVWCWDLRSSFSQSMAYMGTKSNICSVRPQCPRRLQKTREGWTNALICPQSSWSPLLRLSQNGCGIYLDLFPPPHQLPERLTCSKPCPSSHLG